MAKNPFLENLYASLDPDMIREPGQFRMVDDSMPALEKPKPLNPIVGNYLMKKIQAPQAPAAEPVAPMIESAPAVDLKPKAFDYGDFSDENRKKLIDETSGYDLSGNAAAALASLGAAFQGSNSLQAAQSVLDSNRKADQRKLEDFDKGRAGKVQQYDMDRKLTQSSRDDEKLAREADANSQESALARDLAKRLAPNFDFSKMSAAQINEKIPSLTKIYDIEQKKLDRQDARDERRMLAGIKQQDRLDAREQKLNDRDLQLAVPGFERTGEVLPKAEEAVKFRKATATADNLSTKLNRMRDLVKDKGSFEYGGNAGQEMEALATEIQLLGKSPELYELGVLTGPDLSLLQKITADPTSLSSMFTRDGTRLQQIDSQLGSIKQKLDSTSKSLGYRRAGGAESQKAPVSQEDQQAVEWAKANSSDPRAQQILKLHGG